MHPTDDDAAVLATAVHALARAFTTDSDVVAMCLSAAAQLAGTEHASVTAIAGSTPRTVAATDRVAESVDSAQYAVNDGPCLQAARTVQKVVVDLTDDERWPQLRARLLGQTDVRYVVSLPLGAMSAEFVAGSLNLYAAEPFDPGERIGVATALCAIAVAATAERRRADNLEHALRSARSIGAAVGVLMTRRQMTYDEAFDAMRQLSQAAHRKLREVADEVLLTGDLP